MASPAAEGAAVVVASGHMVDAPDRPVARFPASEVDRVTREIAQRLRAFHVGSATTVICGGARGTDIIVAEQALALGATIRLGLAAEVEDFVATSVELPGTDWTPRFRALLTAAGTVVVGGGEVADNRHAVANDAMIDLARSLATKPCGLLVWNGRAGDGLGGTAHFLAQLQVGAHGRIQVVDPTPRAYEHRQTASGPKKLLALDGGGIRGVLTLEILRSIETQLRQQSRDHKLVLADYFDYIGGTSTGAIIAAALALGHSVDDIQRKYVDLAKVVFRKRMLPLRLRSFYPDGRLLTQLTDFFGPGRTLGDSAFRSLLLMVLHNTITDSAWLLSNCTQAKYNRADRNLLTPGDRNLDLALVELLRGSTAAPFYFRPQTLLVGSREIVFQDGGLTPFNNPALLMSVMATLPEYGLAWPAGADNLLVVSVGTGAAASVHPGLAAKKVGLAFNAANFPAVVMGGASVGQDLLARAFGSTRFGEPIDREFGARLNPPGNARFSYVRYNADLSDDKLVEQGIGSAKTRKRIRKLDAVAEVPELRRLGVTVGKNVNIDQHFRGFL